MLSATADIHVDQLTTILPPQTPRPKVDELRANQAIATSLRADHFKDKALMTTSMRNILYRVYLHL